MGEALQLDIKSATISIGGSIYWPSNIVLICVLPWERLTRDLSINQEKSDLDRTSNKFIFLMPKLH